MRLAIVLVGVTACWASHPRRTPIDQAQLVCLACSLFTSNADVESGAEWAEEHRQEENAGIRATGERLEREKPPVIDQALVARGIERVRAEVMACRGHSTNTGRLVVHMKVSPEGAVVAIVVEKTPDWTIADCATAVLRRASFATTRAGGSFRYAFEF